jgi:gamma-glutamyl-gamma-aminobutyrate hydrolase PuuD
MSHEEENTFQENINSLITGAVKTILTTLVPILLICIGMLVTNHFELGNLKEQVKQLSTEHRETRDRVAIIWYVGKYNKQQEQSKE